LIGRHLKTTGAADMPERCCLCESEGIQGFRRKQVIASGFMDVGYLRPTDWICRYCAACLGYQQGRTGLVRNFSFVAGENALQFLKREEIWHVMTDPPEPPFVLGVTYSHKKHISFKAAVNLSRTHFSASTEAGHVQVNPDGDATLKGTMQRWYTICKPTKTEPTWFTKAHVLQGCDNFKRIEEYGTDQYFADDAIIRPYRHTALLELYAYALNKGPVPEQAPEPEPEGKTEFSTRKNGQMAMF